MKLSAIERTQSQLSEDDVVVLSGRLSIREEESPKLLVDRVVPLDVWDGDGRPDRAADREARRLFASDFLGAEVYEAAPPREAPEAERLTDSQLAQRSGRKLYIRLAREKMAACAGQVNVHPGSVPVYLHVPEEKQTYLLPKNQWCDAGSAALESLCGTYGEENVRLVGA